MTPLEPGEAHVWRAELDVDDAALQRWRGLLDATELARADRFYFDDDRRRYAAARGMLREMLGRYLGMDARDVSFEYESSGKPFLRGASTDLKFNVSHSRARGLFAFARGREVGVDVEEGARLDDDLSALARRVFSARERVRWLLRPETERRAAFLDGWTRKEAMLKASGRGIADGLQDIEAPAGAGPAPMAAKGRHGETWTLWNLREFAGCAAALALEGPQPASIRFQVVP